MVLIIFRKPSLAKQPSTTAFHDPALGRHLKAFFRGALDNFQQVAQHGFGPPEQACFVAPIHADVDKVESGSKEADQQTPVASGVRNPGGMHYHGQ